MSLRLVAGTTMHTLVTEAATSPLLAQTLSDSAVIVAAFVVLALVAVTGILLYLAFGITPPEVVDGSDDESTDGVSENEQNAG